MRILTHSIFAGLLGVCLVGFTGCDTPKETTSVDKSGEHAGEGHDEHKGHDHDGDGKEDHAAGDHDKGHDEHAGHDHDGHVDAKAAGLSTDDLVSLDEPAMPDNFNDAVGQLAKLATQVSDGFSNGKIDDAHGPLHDISNLLEGVRTLAKNSTMDDDAKQAVSKTIDKLFADYGAVDHKLHNAKKGKDYADVSDSIKASLETLQGYVKE